MLIAFEAHHGQRILLYASSSEQGIDAHKGMVACLAICIFSARIWSFVCSGTITILVEFLLETDEYIQFVREEAIARQHTQSSRRLRALPF